jgi:hypothetical protein
MSNLHALTHTPEGYSSERLLSLRIFFLCLCSRSKSSRVELSSYTTARFKNKLIRISFHFSYSRDRKRRRREHEEKETTQKCTTEIHMGRLKLFPSAILVSRVPAVCPRSAYSIKRFVGARRALQIQIRHSVACEISLQIVPSPRVAAAKAEK